VTKPKPTDYVRLQVSGPSKAAVKRVHDYLLYEGFKNSRQEGLEPCTLMGGGLVFEKGQYTISIDVGVQT